MEISRKDIYDKTNHGLNIYGYILGLYYPNQVVLSRTGRYCKPTKNPFNQNRPSLLVEMTETVAIHQDQELESFCGDALSFAAAHYQLKGQALYQKLDEDMGLGIANGNHKNHKSLKSHNAGKIVTIRKTRAPKFSFFRKPIQNTTDCGAVDLVMAYKVIQGTHYQKATDKLRTIQDKQQARMFKEKHFDYVTFSGLFQKRHRDALLVHSGLFCADFDHVPDVEGLRKKLLEDPEFETLLLFVSPSGDGLKWVIPIDIRKASHQVYAQAIGKYVSETYGLKMDPSGKDVSRACFLPHDPNIYINPKYL